MFEDKTPADTPIPATMRPTSPLDIIPIPTIIAFDLFLKKNTEGNPHPTNLLTIATVITTADKSRTSIFIPVRFTCAPIIPKNKGPKIICNLSTYSSTRLIIFVLATAIPTENAPTIGDSPTAAAIADAPKNDAVTIPSMLPLAFHNLSVFTILGIMIMAPISNPANIPNIFSIRNNNIDNIWCHVASLNHCYYNG